MTYHYTQPDDEKSAKAVGIALPISLKQAVEICNFIRGKPVEKAVRVLEDVINEKVAVPFKRFNRGGGGHRKGMGPGKYPKKACQEILKIINSAAANAHSKGLGNLALKGITPQKAATTWHFGRKRRRQAKRTHVEVIVSETKEQKERKQKNKKMIERKQND